jgi:hypothetical protein
MRSLVGLLIAVAAILLAGVIALLVFGCPACEYIIQSPW